MNKLIKAIKNGAVSVTRDEEGAQVVEYALIIAVVSLGMILLLKVLVGTSFSTWITRVGTCLTGTTAASCV